MKFSEAMAALEKGKRVRASIWKKNHYIRMENKQEGSITAWCGVPNLLECLGWEWELYEEPEKQLTFAEVVKGLKEWKRFRRKSWPNIDYCIHVTAIGICESYTSKAWFAYPEDFEATDWVEVR